MAHAQGADAKTPTMSKNKPHRGTIPVSRRRGDMRIQTSMADREKNGSGRIAPRRMTAILR